MKYKIKNFWIYVVIIGLVLGAVGVVEYMYLDQFMEHSWLGIVQLAVFAIILAVLFGRAVFLGSLYSGFIGQIISMSYLFMNWEAYTAFLKDSLDAKLAADPKLQAIYDANPQMYEMGTNPPQWLTLIGVILNPIFLGLFALLFGWLIGSFRKRPELDIPETLPSDLSNSSHPMREPLELPSEPIPPEPPRNDQEK